MASVSSLYCFLHSYSLPSSNNKGFSRLRKQRVICCNKSLQQLEHSTLPIEEEERHGSRRRHAMFHIAFTALSFPAIASAALEDKGRIPVCLFFETLVVNYSFFVSDLADDFRVYTDDVNKFKISIPQAWQVGTGEPNGFKSVTAFYPEEESLTSNVSVAITGLGPDYTRMESFGKVDAFAETLVSGLDRSWQRPPGVAAKLIDCKSSSGIYYIEYTLQNPGESCKHLFSAIGMANNGWYNRLYTVTGQFVEEESRNYSSKIEKVIKSFRFI